MTTSMPAPTTLPARAHALRTPSRCWRRPSSPSHGAAPPDTTSWRTSSTSMTAHRSRVAATARAVLVLPTAGGPVSTRTRRHGIRPLCRIERRVCRVPWLSGCPRWVRLRTLRRMATRVPYRPLPIDQTDVVYDHGPDSVVRDGVPAGQTAELRIDDSAVYPGTSRTVWVHVPAAYDPAEAASLMVFNDGWWYLDPEGEVRGGIVLDNLVQTGEIPVTIGVFVDPGVFADRDDADERRNRNAEYDAFDDRYVTFLLDEVLPLVTAGWSLSEDPDRWGICGGSSGGNGAFTAAWLRPDRFRKVVALLSSFAQMPEGNPYPALLPTVPGKPLRLLLQAGHRDLNWDQPEWNWLAENLRTAAALAEAGYDFRLVLGDGGHSANHGGVLLPDALRWVWRANDADGAA